jgi:hypothetical protein
MKFITECIYACAFKNRKWNPDKTIRINKPDKTNRINNPDKTIRIKQTGYN